MLLLHSYEQWNLETSALNLSENTNMSLSATCIKPKQQGENGKAKMHDSLVRARLLCALR